MGSGYGVDPLAVECAELLGLGFGQYGREGCLAGGKAAEQVTHLRQDGGVVGAVAPARCGVCLRHTEHPVYVLRPEVRQGAMERRYRKAARGRRPAEACNDASLNGL